MQGRKGLGCGLMVFGGLVGIATIVGFIFLIFSQIQEMTTGGDRFLAPGSHVVQIDEAGTYSIFHESRSVIDGRVYLSSTAPTSLQLTITAADGTSLPLKPSSGGTYTSGPYEGAALMDVAFPAPGAYTITAAVESAEATTPTVLAVSEGLGPKIMMLVFGGVSLMLVGLFTSTIAFLGGALLLLLGMRKTTPAPG